MNGMKKVVINGFILILLGLAFSPSIFAEQSVEDFFNENKVEDSPTTNTPTDVNEEKKSNSTLEFILSLVKLSVGLIIVLILIYIIANFVKKRNRYVGQNQILENYGGINLGANKSLQTVRIGNQFFVIGVADSIQMLTEITDKETIELLKNKNEMDTNQFHSLFNIIKKKDIQTDSQEQKQFGQLFQKELKEMKVGRQKMLTKIKELSKKDDH